MHKKLPYRFMEVSMGCSDIKAQEAFWQRMFDGKVVFRGRMDGQPFSRMVVCGISLAFREDPDFKAPPGPGQEWSFRNHLGLRVDDLDKAVADLEARGAQFVLTPARVRELQKLSMDNGRKFLETEYIGPPLTAERIAAGEFRIDVAIMVGPDNLWVELNEIREPEDTDWFPA